MYNQKDSHKREGPDTVEMANASNTPTNTQKKNSSFYDKMIIESDHSS